MIQSSNSHIRRLMTEKSQHEKEMEEAKEKFKTALSGILSQCESSVTLTLHRLGCVMKYILLVRITLGELTHLEPLA